MKMTSTAILLLILIEGIAGCGSESAPTTPSTPTRSPQPGPVQLAMFSDPASSFTTSDVRDVQEQIVRFDVTSNSPICAADSLAVRW
jgi:hypothetical protein